MVSGDFCEHDWPGSGCPECRSERETRKKSFPIGEQTSMLSPAGRGAIAAAEAHAKRRKPTPKLYTLHLTADELYYLDQGYSASFLEPGQQNKDEKNVSKKLLDLTLKAHRDKKNGR